MLLDDGKPLRLGSRALDILIALVERAGETITKEQLIARIWPDMVVDEGALRVHVAALRKALGDGRAGRRYVANNPGRGYAFSAPVVREKTASPPVVPTGMAEAGNLPHSHTGHRPRRCHRRPGGIARPAPRPDHRRPRRD